MIFYERLQLEQIDNNTRKIIEHAIKTNFSSFIQTFSYKDKEEYLNKLQGLSIIQQLEC